MIVGLLILFACQIAGELIAQSLGLLIPGPVVGMLILLALLFVRKNVYSATQKTAHWLLRNLSLFFIPAGVGVMTLSQTLRTEGLLLLVVIAVSTWVTALCAAVVSERLIKQ